jgi:beta-xylosidase
VVPFQDHRIADAVDSFKRLGVTYLRTGISWADYFRPNAIDWVDRQMEALADFAVTVTFCFTPEHRGIAQHHTSPPISNEEFAEFCASMVRRYASDGASLLSHADAG